MNAYHKLAALTLLLFTVCTPLRADTPGTHPHYVHALDDLNNAHAILISFHYGDSSDQAWADKEVRFALREVLRAAWDDGKNTNAVVSPDVNLSHADQLRQARRLLQGARRDLQVAEDNPSAYGWRAAALDHINRSINYLSRAIQADGQ